MISNINGHSPLPGNVYIDNSPIHGMGLFAKSQITKGHDFGITHVADKRFNNGYIRTPFGGFINHSYNPNCEIVEEGDTLHVRTLTDVNEGDELTVDYRPYYTEEEMATYK